MTEKTLNDKLLIKLIDFIEENEIEMDGDVSVDTRLLGSASIFDSIELVTFIVEVEQFLDEEFGFQTQLTSENAMSRRNSPFISVKTLSSYILELYNE